MLDSTILQNEKFASMPVMARMLVVGMVVTADDQGRGKAHPVFLRSQIFPYEDVPQADIEQWLALASKNETVLIYSVDGKDYYQFVNWWTYQSHQYAMPSQFPKPLGWSDRIRKSITKGHIVTCNWITSDGTRSPDTCDEQGKLVQVNDQVIKQVNDQVIEQVDDQVDVQPEDTSLSISLSISSSISSNEDSPPAVQKKSKKSQVAHDPSQQQEMFGVVAEVCDVNPQLKASMIGKTATSLLKAGYTPKQVLRFPAWWSNDWHGKNGNAATMGQLLEFIKQAVGLGENAPSQNGSGPTREKVEYTIDYGDGFTEKVLL